jgi:hypothetical protein
MLVSKLIKSHVDIDKDNWDKDIKFKTVLVSCSRLLKHNRPNQIL